MRDFLRQIRLAIDANLYFVALFSVLAIPDLCGAISSKGGTSSKKKYIEWFDKYVAANYFLKGEDCYYFRCSLLHQGSSQHEASNYQRVLFVEPASTTHVFHNNIIMDALNIDVTIFCQDMVKGVEVWLKEVEETELYGKNYDKFLRRYPNGLSPYIVGIPVIS